MKTRQRDIGESGKATNDDSKPLENQVHDALKLLILPKGTSPYARICTLSHPRTSTLCRYYFCPEKGIYEFTRIAAPKSARQSWLLGRQLCKVGDSDHVPVPVGQAEGAHILPDVPSKAEDGAPRPVSDGYIVKSPELLIATPIDSLFLVLPALYAKSNAKSSSSKGLFLSADDILETLEDNSNHFREVSSHNRIRHLMEERMSAVCDTVDAGDETMFRLNIGKLLAELVSKARAVVNSGLPASMEAKFVSRALERPVMALKREASSLSETAKVSSDDTAAIESAPTISVDSQSSTTTSNWTDSEVSVATDVTIPSQLGAGQGSGECLNILRLRVALSYMFSSYVPQPLVVLLNALLASDASPIDFKPLDEELAVVAKMRSEALASRSLSDFSRKRGVDDDEAAAIRAEKKAKKEEEEKKKKAGETRGIRDLKKVDTTGMKKMSDFFGKTLAAKKEK